MDNLKIYCMCLENNYLDIVKKLNYIPVGLKNKNFSNYNQISLNTKFSNTLFFTPIRKHASSASLWYNQGQYNTVISFIINYYVINSQ